MSSIAFCLKLLNCSKQKLLRVITTSRNRCPSTSFSRRTSGISFFSGRYQESQTDNAWCNKTHTHTHSPTHRHEGYERIVLGIGRVNGSVNGDREGGRLRRRKLAACRRSIALSLSLNSARNELWSWTKIDCKSFRRWAASLCLESQTLWLSVRFGDSVAGIRAPPCLSNVSLNPRKLSQNKSKAVIPVKPNLPL